MLKAPSVQKYDDRQCLFDDSLNYLCLEHSIDLRLGWEIKQKWEVATDINPPVPTAITTPAYTYVAPNTINNVGYKYKWKFQPYSVASFNLRPNFKIDRLFMNELQFNIDQFKSSVYLELVYYQKALKYTYPTGPPVKDAKQPDPTESLTYTTSTTDLPEETDGYKLPFLNVPYPGKICVDIGYNSEDIAVVLKTAINWRDCYKNLFMSFADYSNWLGPKA